MDSQWYLRPGHQQTVFFPSVRSLWKELLNTLRTSFGVPWKEKHSLSSVITLFLVTHWSPRSIFWHKMVIYIEYFLLLVASKTVSTLKTLKYINLWYFLIPGWFFRECPVTGSNDGAPPGSQSSGNVTRLQTMWSFSSQTIGGDGTGE